VLHAQLQGRVAWHGGAHATACLAGTIDYTHGEHLTLQLTLTPADANQPFGLHVLLQSQSKHVDLHVPLLALADWWSQLNKLSPQLTLPPLNGTFDATQLNAAGVSIEGLHIRADNMPAPSVDHTQASP
jgi:AsmA protein